MERVTRYYSVAEHIFAIEAESAILSQCPNYAPFGVSPIGFPLFRLRVVSEPLPLIQSKQPLFMDQSDADMPRIEVSRVGADWLFEMSMWRQSPICCRLLASADFAEATLSVETSDVRFAIDNAAMLLYAFATAVRQTLVLHASAVVCHRAGQVFLGWSGTGKSTHARLWQERYAEAWLLNDDNPVLRVQGDCVRIYGSPWSGKTPCYRAESAPLQAIVKLTQASHNAIARLRMPQAFAYLLSSSSGLKTDSEHIKSLHDTIASVVQSIPMYELSCLPDVAAAELCHDTLYIHPLS